MPGDAVSCKEVLVSRKEVVARIDVVVERRDGAVEVAGEDRLDLATMIFPSAPVTIGAPGNSTGL
jgi:hypothetical protein